MRLAEEPRIADELVVSGLHVVDDMRPSAILAPNAAHVLSLVVMPLPSLTNTGLPEPSTPTAMRILLRESPRGDFPSGRCQSLPAASETYVSSIRALPARTVSSWTPSSTAKSLAIQYGSVVLLRLPSLVISDTLAYEKVWRRKSAHADSGSFLSSNAAPVTGADALRHDVRR